MNTEPIPGTTMTCRRRFERSAAIIFLALLIGFALATAVGHSQNTNTDPPSAAIPGQTTEGSGNSEELGWLFQSSAFQGLILGLLALLGTCCGLLQNKLSKSKEKFETQLHSDVKVPANSKKNSIMVIGIGGSGKTSIRNSICAPESSGTEERTIDYTTKSVKLQTDGNGQDYYFYVSDYKGQDFGTLIYAFITQQLQAYTPMRFRFINTLIVVVDLIDPIQHLEKGEKQILDKDGKPKLFEFEDFNDVRIKEHIEQWNRTALDAVFGLQSRESLSYVCLFINKFNLLSDLRGPMRQRILTEYKPLIEELSRRCQFLNEKTGKREYYAQFEVKMGNAQALPASILGNLKKFSVPHAHNYQEIAIDERTTTI